MPNATESIASEGTMPIKKVAIAGDHAGFSLKQHLVEFLRSQGYEVLDLGTADGSVPSDYPDFAEALAQSLERGEAPRGILVCGSGVGVSVAANKFPHVYAALCHDTYSAHQGVEHDGMNVLCLGARIVGSALATEIATAFLRAEVSDEARHVRRRAKIQAIEARLRNEGPGGTRGT